MNVDTIVVQCCKCDTYLQYSGSPKHCDDVVRRWYELKGWSVGPKPLPSLCPKCLLALTPTEKRQCRANPEDMARRWIKAKGGHLKLVCGDEGKLHPDYAVQTGGRYFGAGFFKGWNRP